MDKWVLKAVPDVSGFGMSDGYYTGKSYTYQHGKYAVVERDISLAKTYSSYPKAVAANNKLAFENYSFTVKRLSEQGE